jgi:hypothetical protein
MRFEPLRSFERVIAGYATLAFALGAGESAVMHEWSYALLGVIFAAAGVALLLYDHRQWRAARRVHRPDAPGA